MLIDGIGVTFTINVGILGEPKYLGHPIHGSHPGSCLSGSTSLHVESHPVAAVLASGRAGGVGHHPKVKGIGCCKATKLG